MSYNQQQPPVGVPPPQGYPYGYGNEKDAYPPPGYPAQGYPAGGYPPPGGYPPTGGYPPPQYAQQPPPQQQSSGPSFMEGWLSPSGSSGDYLIKERCYAPDAFRPAAHTIALG